MNEPTPSSLFVVRDCTLAPIATGIKAQTASEFRDRLAIVNPGCIFYHFWSSRLRSSIEQWQHHNEFSWWAYHCLHDNALAERLELLNPTEYSSLEDLRREMIDILEDRLDEQEIIPWAKTDEQFHFIRSKIIVFTSKYRFENLNQLVDIFPLLSRSSLFYHFIDARRRTPNGEDDFTLWLKSFPEPNEALIEQLHQIDPYFIALSDLQSMLLSIFSNHMPSS